MFIELTLAVPSKRKIWFRADAITALTVWDGKTQISTSSIPDNDGVSVVETPDYIMGKIVETSRWNR